MLQAAPSLLEVRPPSPPSLVSLALEDPQHDKYSKPHRSASPRLTAESTYSYKSLPSTELGGTAHTRKVEDMGHQFEALKVRSTRHFKAEFSAEPPFSP